MVMVRMYGLTRVNMLENGKIINVTVMEFNNGMMVPTTKDTGETTSSTVEAQ